MGKKKIPVIDASRDRQVLLADFPDKLRECVSRFRERIPDLENVSVREFMQQMPFDELIHVMKTGGDVGHALEYLFDALFAKLNQIDKELTTMNELFEAAQAEVSKEIMLKAVGQDDLFSYLLKGFIKLHHDLEMELVNATKVMNDATEVYNELKKLHQQYSNLEEEFIKLRVEVTPLLTDVQGCQKRVLRIGIIEQLEEKRELLDVMVAERKELSKNIFDKDEELFEKISLINTHKEQINRYQIGIQSDKKTLSNAVADPYSAIEEELDENLVIRSIEEDERIYESFESPDLSEMDQLAKRINVVLDPVKMATFMDKYFPDCNDREFDIVKKITCALESILTTRSRRGRTLRVVINSINDVSGEKLILYGEAVAESVIERINLVSSPLFVINKDEELDEIYYILTDLGKQLANYWWQDNVLPLHMRGEKGSLRNFISKKDLPYYKNRKK